MIREIELHNKKIVYHLQLKKVKNINLRLRPDGSLCVSANKNVPQKTIDAFILSKAGWIDRALEKYKNMSENLPKPYYTENEIKEHIQKLCKEVYPYFEKLGVSYPTVLFRKMVSRWGSCHTQKGILTFNTNLMYAPPACVKYVVLHEFTHFLQPNHSKNFYNEMAKVCPNWKELRKKLKEIYWR